MMVCHFHSGMGSCEPCRFKYIENSEVVTQKSKPIGDKVQGGSSVYNVLILCIFLKLI
jgi:hypothetical protein